VGQLGDGSLVDSPLPEQVLPIPLRGLKSLSLSSGTLFPRFDAGNFTYNGTVGSGVTSLSVTPTATDPSFGIMVNSLAVTSGSASTAIPLVVGANTINVVASSPQLGKSWTYVLTITRAPQTVQAVAPVFVSGLNHALVLRPDGSLWAWGWNSNGELGDGTANDATVPRQIGAGYTAVSAGAFVSMGVKSDGSLWTWGNGPLGDSTLQRNAPVQVATGFATVAAGWNNGAGFKSDGSLWIWGDSRWGQFGGATAPVGNFDPSFRLLGPGYSAISLGIGHVVALRPDGTLLAWGKNDFGQVGDGQSGNQACADSFGRPILCRFVPAQIGTGYSAISAGADYTLALKQDGTLWAWGDNSAGQLGDGTTTRRLIPIQIVGNFVSIAAGTRFSAALKADGSLWVWGNTIWVGGSELGAPLTLVPKQIATGFSAVAVGSGSILAKRMDGTLWAWGANSFGQLGTGLYADATTPQLVINETVTGIFDLDPAVPNSISPSAIPKIILEASKKGELASLTLGTNVYFGTIDLGALAAGTFSASGPYKVYVAAIVPAGITGVPAGTYLLDTNRSWSLYSGGPLREYVSNATLDQTQHYFVSILEGTNLTGLIGTRIMVGYGVDAPEMLAAQRYREIYVAQPAPAQ
jgi:alpha-tubulin suppressor-like RCC1 family protein